MRGFLQPAVKATVSETQSAFGKLTRGRRAKLAKASQTTLVKADQWANGGAVSDDVSKALEAQMTALAKKAKK